MSIIRELSDRHCSCGCGRFTFKAHHAYGKYAKGDPIDVLRGHGGTHNKGVKLKSVPAQYRGDWLGRKLHRLRAERALGKALPKGTVVHHADGSINEDAPLVICQNEGYHRLLHTRMRVKAAGGNPNTDLVCGRCRLAKNRDEFYVKPSHPYGRNSYCKPCEIARVTESRKRRAA